MTSGKALLTGIRGVIVDLDGTMAHTAPEFQLALNKMREELGLAPISLETVTRFVGKGMEYLVRSSLALDFPPDQLEQRFDQALDSYRRHYHAINGDCTTLYPGVKEGLQSMQAKGLRVACVTNKPIGFTIPLLEKLGLRGFFEIVYGGDSFAKKKPDPLPLLQVCKEFGLEPQQVVAIGDSINDAQAARAAGCRVLTVPYGYNHGHPIQEVDSDGIVDTLLDAADLIEN